MTEIFTSKGLALGLPSLGTLVKSSSQENWETSGTDGFWIKPLFEDQESGQRTWLMKVDSGAESPMHAHSEVEQIFVIEGSFFDQDRTYQTGDFAIRAPGTMHTAGSEDGALVLLIYT